jgi:hypothetical protein
MGHGWSQLARQVRAALTVDDPIRRRTRAPRTASKLSRRRCALVAMAALTVAAACAQPAQARTVRPQFSAPHSVVVGKTCAVTVRLSRIISATAVLQQRRLPRWLVVSTARLKGRVAKLRCRTGKRAGKTLRLRVLVRRGGRTVARSRMLTVRIKSAPEFTIPATTRVYERAGIASATPGPAAGQVTVVLRRGQRPPVVGGHAALAPASGLPYGMLAHVLKVHQRSTGASVVLETAAVDEVFANVDYSFDGPVTPVLVDENGNPVPNSQTRSGALVIRGDANGDLTRQAAPRGAFDCKEAGGIPRGQEAVWDTGLPLPIEIKLENTRVLHNFDAGSLYPRRAPSLLLQFSGEAVATVGVQAKTGFECSLSDAFRRSHRIQLPIRNIGPVPISIYLEPQLKFSVSAAGKVALSQRHYFSYTLEKHGTDPLSFRRGSSAEPVKFEVSARLDASLFAGGDLSLLIGAAGGSTTNIGAGMYGAFGPEFALSTSNAQPGCVSAAVHLRGDLGVRLQLWTKRWNLELASLTGPDLALRGSPYCGLPTGGGGGGAGGTGAGGAGGGGGGGGGGDEPGGSSDPVPVMPIEQNISAGDRHTCYRTPSGQPECVGATPGADVRTSGNVLHGLSSGWEFTCALTLSGQPQCWGLDDYNPYDPGDDGESSPPPGALKQVSAGYERACGVRPDDTLVCWGQTDWGPPPTGTYVQVSVGGRAACALRSDTTLACWGPSTALSSQPPGGHFAQVSVGDDDTACALRGDGTARCWGRALTGAPVGSYRQISTGRDHACGVRATGEIHCWGSATNGQTSPPAGAFSEVSAGAHHTCGLRTDDTPICWGANESAQAALPGGTFTRVAAGSSMACGLRSDATAECWGYVPGPVPDGAFTDLSIGVYVNQHPDGSAGTSADTTHVCGLRPGGALVCWGRNTSGESSAPGGTFAAVTAGGDHSCALRADQTAACWGGNQAGESNPPTGTFAAISAGTDFTCALRPTGTIECWGDNTYGPLNAPTGTYSRIDAEGQSACAITTDQTPVCWGKLRQGTITNGSATDIGVFAFGSLCQLRSSGAAECTSGSTGSFPRADLTQLSIGGVSACGLRSNGAAECWGAIVHH